MMRTIIISILIVIVINYIVHFLKDSFTQPMVKYLEVSVPKYSDIAPQQPVSQSIDQSTPSKPDMKDELSNFLMSINI